MNRRTHDDTGEDTPYARALAAFQSWRQNANALAEEATRSDPASAMPLLLRCWIALCGRDPAGRALARPLHDRAAPLVKSPLERAHLAAVRAAIDDDYDGCVARLSQQLDDDPHDVLALQVAHAFDYLAGEASAMLERTSRAQREWSPAMPGRHAVLAMHAFALEENGDYELAEAIASEALALDPFDVRALHTLVHVCEMTGRPADGLRLLGEHAAVWTSGSTASTHCWWHAALFHLAERRTDHVLSLYDRRLRPAAGSGVSDLIDASALLWRLLLDGVDAGDRWPALAAAWAPRLRDCHCTFSDLHAMLAFVGAGDWRLADELLHVLAERRASPTRHGRTTRALGLPAARALAAFGHGDYVAAIEGLAPLTAATPRLGGSHAQRDVLHLTLREAIDRMRAHPQVARRAA